MTMLRFLLFVTFGFISVAGAFAPSGAMAQEIETTAPLAYVLDYDTGTVLLDKNGGQRMPTSSMSKVLTMYLVFGALKTEHWRLDEDLPVSEKAWRMQGSKMFVDINTRVKVEDLIRGVIIQSGNDATIVLAEGLAGNEEAFAQMMNAKAKELGMNDSHFMNASGWPDPEHYSTPHDLAVLAAALIRDYPEYYKYYAEKEFTYHGIKQGNRNPLLYKNIGADGIKTGHTEDAGYGLIGTGVQDGRRVIIVVNGLKSMQERADESAKLLEWGLKRFENKNFTKAGAEIERARVAFGQQRSVPMTTQQDLILTLPRGAAADMKLEAVYQEPVIAPVQAGQALGVLKISSGDKVIKEVPLLAAQDVPKMSFFALTMAKAQALLLGAY